MNKADPKAINDEVSRILRKDCDSSFKATEREARVMAFASKPMHQLWVSTLLATPRLTHQGKKTILDTFPKKKTKDS